MNKPSYAIVMFAYNEEKHIETSVRSIFTNIDARLQSLSVIANGCTDTTVAILKKMAQQPTFSKLKVIELSLGDKCNAWNEYVHHLHCDAEVHFFTDADVEFTPMAFPRMFDTLLGDEKAHAIAGLPFSGRNKKYYRSLVTDRSCLFGNCYGVKKEFFHLIRDKNFKLPKGLCWIDSAITKAVNSDVNQQDIGIPGRVTFNLNCGYKFTSLNPFKKDDRNLYFSRIARYATGKLQEKYLEQLSFTQWPQDLNAINSKILDEIYRGKVKLPFYLKKRILKRLQRQL